MPLEKHAFVDVAAELGVLETASNVLFYGLRLLVQTEDASLTHRVAHELRQRGAVVGVIDVRGRGLQQGCELDPQAILVDAYAPREPLFGLVRHDRRLRWASVVPCHWERWWPASSVFPNMAPLWSELAPRTAPDRSLQEIARDVSVTSFRVPLQAIGPGRVLRSLTGAAGVLRVFIETETTLAIVELSGDFVVHASVQGLDAASPHEVGTEALATLLRMRSGDAWAERSTYASSFTVMRSIEEALTEAAQWTAPGTPRIANEAVDRTASSTPLRPADAVPDTASVPAPDDVSLDATTTSLVAPDAHEELPRTDTVPVVPAFEQEVDSESVSGTGPSSATPGDASTSESKRHAQSPRAVPVPAMAPLARAIAASRSDTDREPAAPEARTEGEPQPSERGKRRKVKSIPDVEELFRIGYGSVGLADADSGDNELPAYVRELDPIDSDQYTEWNPRFQSYAHTPIAEASDHAVDSWSSARSPVEVPAPFDDSLDTLEHVPPPRITNPYEATPSPLPPGAQLETFVHPAAQPPASASPNDTLGPLERVAPPARSMPLRSFGLAALMLLAAGVGVGLYALLLSPRGLVARHYGRESVFVPDDAKPTLPGHLFERTAASSPVPRPMAELTVPSSAPITTSPTPDDAIDVLGALESTALPNRGASDRMFTMALGSSGAQQKSLLVKAVELDTTNPHPLAALSRVLLEEGDSERALVLARRCVMLRPKRDAYQVLLGDVLAARGERGAAARAYRTADRLHAD